MRVAEHNSVLTHKPTSVRFLIAIFIVTVSLLCPNAYAATQLSQYGITWTFDQDYTIGQFANGDYWVVGPVTIIGIDPPSLEINGRAINGSMVNPSPTLGTTQGYDSEMYAPYSADYSSDLNVAFGVDGENPLIVSTGSSLVSSISNEESDFSYQLRSAAILTVLQSPAPDGSFRPPYVNASKNIRFNKSQLDYSVLSELSPIESVPTVVQQGGDDQSDSLERMFERPWIDHIPQWRSRALHPEENMQDYGANMAKQVGDVGLALNLDFSQLPGNPSKETLLIRFVQFGIDCYGMIQDGGRENFAGAGGHTVGRKFPILFAGLVLDDMDMKNIGAKSGDYVYDSGHGPENVPEDYIWFSADDQTFHVAETSTGVYNWGEGGYGAEEVGTPEWGQYHLIDLSQDSESWGAGYRNICSAAHPGFVLAVLIMGQKAAWNHDALFDYQDRWWNYTVENHQPGRHPHQSTTAFTRDMWLAYRADYPPVWSESALSDDVPPLPPTNLVSSTLTGSTITLSWIAPGNASDGDSASSYRIFREDVQVGSASTTSFVDTELTAQTSYNYEVYSLDDAGNQSLSAAMGTFSTGTVTLNEYTLNVTVLNGSVSRSPNLATYTEGSQVTLQVTPDSGYSFTGWSGDLAGSSNPVVLIMDSDRNVTANLTTVGGSGNLYYVDASDSSASDSNPGTESLPWLTVQHAANNVQAGDTVIVNQGTYNERIIFPASTSGSAGQKITFRAQPRRSATIWGFDTQNANYLRIEGFDITNSFSGYDGYGVYIRSDYVEVVDNYFHHLQWRCIDTSSTLNTGIYVADNRMYYVGAGMRVGGNDWLIENNEIERLVRGAGDADNIRFFGNNIAFRNNYFHGTLQSEIGVSHTDCFQTYSSGGDTHNVIIENNICLGFYNQGVIARADPGTHSDIIVRNNIFAHGSAWGVAAENIPGVVVVNNVFADIGWYGVGLSGVSDNGVIKNNIFYNTGNADVYFSEGSNLDADYNIVYGRTLSNPGPHDLLGMDPLFVDAGNDDYRLQENSPAIDAGIDTSQFGVVGDIEGISRPLGSRYDIGAYEYQDGTGDNTPPSANAGADQTVSDSDNNGIEQVVLNGSGSTDTDGTIVSWIWIDDQEDTIPEGESVTASLSVGNHLVTLTVTDDNGASNTDTVAITVTAPPQDGYIIVDHTAIELFDQIPDYWMDKVKQDRMLVQYVGQSHALQMECGLNLLEQQDPKYAVQISPDLDYLTGTNVLRILRSQYDNDWIPDGQWRGWGEEEYWANENARVLTEGSAQQAINQGDPINISIFGWCWDVIRPNYCYDETGTRITFNDERRDAYLSAISRFNNNPSINQTNFVYHTAVTDDDYTTLGGTINEAGLRVTQYNDDIRAGAIANNGILFDQADIENYDNATNTQQRIETWNGHDLYLRHTDYDEGTSINTCGNDHTDDALCIRKAKALWVLMARIAGWNGNSGTPANQAPTANAGLNQTVTDSDGNGSEQVNLNGSASTDPDGTIQSYIWREGTTEIANGVNPNIVLTAGTHTITLTVTDDGGLTDADTVIITVSAQPDGTGIDAWWKFDETNGSTAMDSSGNGNTATLINGPTWTGQGQLAFDGIDDYVDAGDSTFNLNDEFTISVWVYVNADSAEGEKMIIERGPYVFPFRIGLVDHNVRSCVRTSAGTNYLDSDSTLAWEQWHHIAMTYIEGSYILYINGQEDIVDTIPPSGTLRIDAGYTTVVGMWSGTNRYFDGMIDDTRIYNRALSADEISELHNEEAPTPANNPPTADDDYPIVHKGSGANTIDVLANDTDADGDTLTITSVTQPDHGSVAITGGGTGLAYTPTPDYNGPDSFTYTISDGQGGIDTAMVSITVIPVSTVVSATATKFGVEVLFSEDLEQSSARNVGNYTLSNGILINAVALNAEPDKVTLYTTAHAEDTNYTLTITGVEDLDGNPILEDIVEYTYDSGLIGLWNFNTDGGNTALDASGYDNTATLVNGLVWTEQGDLNFDGIDDAVEIPTNYWNVGGGTVALWAYADDLAGTHYLFGHTTGSGNDKIQLYTLEENLNLGLGNLDELNIENLDSQTWHHFALTWEGTDYVVYVDGIEKSSGSYTGLNNLSEFADIGNSGDVSFDNAFAGHIDDARIYNRALSLDEIINVYLMSDESIRESKALAFEIIVTYPDGTPLTYSINQLPDGATFEDDTFTWNPWYDQAGTYDITFLPADQERPQYSQTVTVVVEDVQLSGWYQRWLEHLGLL